MDDVPAYRLANAASRVANTVTLDRGPIGGIAVTADGQRLLATNYGDDTVSIIDTVSCKIVNTVFQADEPFSVAAGPAGTGWAYVTAGSTALDAVLAIDVDTAQVAGCYPVAMDIGDLVADPTSSRVYLTRTGSAGVDVLALDAAMRPAASAAVSGHPGAAAAGLRISADGRRLYAAVRQPTGDIVTVLDRDLNIVDTIRIGASIIDVAVSPDGARLYVATSGPDGRSRVHVVDARTHAVSATRVLEAQLIQLIAGRDGQRVYLVTDGAVLVLCARTNEPLGTLPGITAPSCAAESPDGSRLYIAGFDGKVTIASLADLPAPSALLHEQLELDDAVTRMLQLEPAV
ncbi:YncE family protein [Mycobacterium sp. SMC-11]|uniref:YncE family protein n=1 Tax=Mycobacterium sp. SMC-11 TaxID=3385969 RepID=UPI00390C66A0